jgi:hypothetical protein
MSIVQFPYPVWAVDVNRAAISHFGGNISDELIYTKMQ